MKKTILLLVVFLFAFTLAFPKGNGEKSGDSGKKVTVKYATWRVEDKDVFTKLEAQFEAENPNIDLVMDYYTSNDVYYNTVYANAVAGEGLDAFDHHPNDQLYLKAADGIMADVSSLGFASNLTTSAKDVVTYKDMIIGYPSGVNLICLIYNKQIFSENGLKEPKTFDELVNVVNTLKGKGYGGIAYLGNNVRADWLSDAIGCSAMGPAEYNKFLESMDNGTVTDPANTKAMVVFKTLKAIGQNKLLYDNSVSVDYAASLSLFAQKKTAIVMMGTWTFGTKQNDYPGIDIGIMPFPTLDNNKFYAEPAQITCVYNGSKNKDAALKWVKFISTPANSATYLNAVKWTPTLKGVSMNFEGADMLIKAMDQGVAIKMPPNLPNAQLWTVGLKDAYAKLLFDNADLNATIAELTTFLKKVNPQLKK